MSDHRQTGWDGLRKQVEQIDLLSLEEAAGALLEFAGVEDPESYDRIKHEMPPAQGLVAKVALMLVLETRWRYDTSIEGMEGG